MIPKVIHYCWFGGNPMSELGEKCLASWKQYCPDYEIVRWDESNYDVTQNTYMKEAYDAGKYSFVSDYARLDIIYKQGGIYLDTDVELIQSLDALIIYTYMGIGCTGGVATGLGFGAEAGNEILREMRDMYDGIHFLNKDGSYNTIPCVQYQTEFLKKYGYIDRDERQTVAGIEILPTEYLCPMDYRTGALNLTKNTISIHHYESTHWSPRQRDANLRMRAAYKKYGKFGFYCYSHSRVFRLIDALLSGNVKELLRDFRKIR